MGGGRIKKKIKSFCEILNKMSQKEGGAKDRRPSPPLYGIVPIYLFFPQGVNSSKTDETSRPHPHPEVLHVDLDGVIHPDWESFRAVKQKDY